MNSAVLQAQLQQQSSKALDNLQQWSNGDCQHKQCCHLQEKLGLLQCWQQICFRLLVKATSEQPSALRIVRCCCCHLAGAMLAAAAGFAADGAQVATAYFGSGSLFCLCQSIEYAVCTPLHSQPFV